MDGIILLFMPASPSLLNIQPIVRQAHPGFRYAMVRNWAKCICQSCQHAPSFRKHSCSRFSSIWLLSQYMSPRRPLLFVLSICFFVLPSLHYWLWNRTRKSGIGRCQQTSTCKYSDIFSDVKYDDVMFFWGWRIFISFIWRGCESLTSKVPDFRLVKRK